VCGEFIAGLSIDTISRLGLSSILADALEHREIAWFLGDAQKPARVQRLPSPALGLSRHELDARLAAAFTAAGGDLRTNIRVADLAPRAGRVFATGRRRGRAAWLGLKLHARDLTLARDLELHLGDHAYVGLTRIDRDTVNICGLFRRRDLCAKGSNLLLGYLQAAGLPSLANRLTSAHLVPDSFCAVAALDFDPRIPADGRVYLGDACAMIPPFTGNGMAMAFQSAEAALDPLLEYTHGQRAWEPTVALITAALRRRFRLRLTSADVLHSFLLEPPRQRVLTALNRARLLPLRPLYAALH
jgi:2-polyprenyl-6-methoxyphenol hydroxylase-like FAD-dependent oxidoreductase